MIRSLLRMTKISKLVPDLTPLSRWMHGFFKNRIRDFVNEYGESKEMEEILRRKLGKPGWVQPEIANLWNQFENMMATEHLVWQAKDDKESTINRNERFWTNFRKIVCVLLDEDTYYFERFKAWSRIAATQQRQK